MADTDDNLAEQYSNHAAKAFDHPMVQRVLDEFALNMRFERTGLREYGLMKICNVMGQVAIAVANGVDPEDLRPSYVAVQAELERRAAGGRMLLVDMGDVG